MNGADALASSGGERLARKLIDAVADEGCVRSQGTALRVIVRDGGPQVCLAHLGHVGDDRQAFSKRARGERLKIQG